MGQQAQPAAKQPAEKKQAVQAKAKMAGNYTMHSSVELGGVITQRDGSKCDVGHDGE